MQVGTAAELYETPANAFVANFNGDCCLVDGQIDEWRFVFHSRAFHFVLGSEDGATLMNRQISNG
ncbi:ABC-type Fe3+/spermidine/putrescine transport system ATPase subunit [Bradyrhizobium sp. GM2.4]